MFGENENLFNERFLRYFFYFAKMHYNENCTAFRLDCLYNDLALLPTKKKIVKNENEDLKFIILQLVKQ